MALTVQQIIDDLIDAEGREYTNDPHDKGGPTKFGITLKTLSEHRGVTCSSFDVQELTETEARKIYLIEYYYKSHVDLLDEIIRPFVFDMVVNHGPHHAAVILQTVLIHFKQPVRADGVLGPRTRAGAAIACNIYGGAVLTKLIEERKAFYQHIVDRHPDQSRFLKGWLARADSFAE